MMISRWDNLPLCCSSGGSRDRSLSTSSLLRLPVLKCEMESAITITSMLLAGGWGWGWWRLRCERCRCLQVTVASCLLASYLYSAAVMF